jgi:UPF0755 protein
MTDLGFHLDDEREDEDEPIPPARRGRLLMVLLAPMLIVAVGVLALSLIARSGPEPIADYEGEGGGEVRIRIISGDTLTAIGRTLQEEGVVRDYRAFVQVAIDDPRANGIGPGVYAMRSQMSASSALLLLLDPSSRLLIRFVVPEGTRADRIAQIVSRAADVPVEDVRELMADRDAIGLPDYAPTAEGFLFPATYEFDIDTSVQDVLAAMVRRFEESATRVDLVEGAARRGLTPLEIVTIASIVEGEVAPDDFPKASRVVYNRLDRGMRLQMDSTLNYGLGSSTLMFTRDQLSDTNPYNTYVIDGLPPGPIGSPGERALRAALEPEDGTWLFFVSVNPDEKLTKFATTEAEFFRLRAEFRAWYRENR